MWSSEPSQQWENFFDIIVLQFVGHPPSRYRIWFVIVALLPSYCSIFFVFGRGVSSFDGLQRPPVSGYSADSYSFALSRKISTRPSIPPSWPEPQFSLLMFYSLQCRSFSLLWWSLYLSILFLRLQFLKVFSFPVFFLRFHCWCKEM